MRAWRILLSLLLLSSALQAKPLFDEPRSYLEVEMMSLDSPEDLYQYGKAAFQSTDPSINPKRWVIAILALGHTPLGVREIPDAESVISRARKIALEQRMLEEELRLEQLLAYNIRGDDKTIEKFMEESVVTAEKRGLTRVKIRLLANNAYNFRNSDQSKKSVQILQEVSEYLKTENSLTPFDRVFIRNSMAVNLDTVGQLRQAESIYLDIIPKLEEMHLRSFLSSVHYNLGRLFNDQFDPELSKKAEPHFQKSLKYAREIDDKESVAAALIGLAQVSYILEDQPQSIKQSQEALAIAEVMQDNNWILESLKTLARSQTAAQLYKESLTSITRAASLSSHKKSDQRFIELELAKAYKGLQQWKEAFEHRDTAAQLAADIAEERSGKEFAQQVTKLGLDVETEKSKALEQENAFKEERLKSASLWRYVMLAFLVFSVLLIVMLFQIVSRERDRVAEKEKTSRILDSLEEGVLLIDRAGLVEPGYSKFLTRLLHLTQDVTGQPVVSTIFAAFNMESETKAILQSALHAILGEDSLAWDFNHGLLPSELWTIDREPRCLELHWQPMTTKGHVLGLLIGIRDITDRKKLQESLLLEKNKSDHIYEKFQEWLKVDRKLMQQVLDQLAQFKAMNLHDSLENTNHLLRFVHTLKGVTRSVGMRSLSQGFHSLEDDFRAGKDPHLNWNQLMKDISDFEWLAKNTGVIAKVDEDLNWIQFVETVWQDVRQRLDKEQLPIDSLVIEDGVGNLPKALRSFIESFLVHGLNNAIDHGFIRAKATHGELPAVRVEISGKITTDTLRFTVRDNGVGIDLQQIKVLAQLKNFQPGPGQTIIDVLFEDGITTATEASQSSGRGIGLSAIRELCQRQGGRIQLLPNPSGGSMLVAEIPRDKTWMSAA